MGNNWVYGKYGIKEGFKPGSSHFQYFFAVSEDGLKKCNYCVWIADDAIDRFGSSGNFNSIVSSQGETWRKWITDKIDAKDFGNKVLKIEKDREKEIELSEMKTHFSMD
jgi:hypothetical protein